MNAPMSPTDVPPAPSAPPTPPHAREGSTVEVSVIIPVMNEAGAVRMLADQVHGVLAGLAKSHEIIFVDDGSTDETPALLEEICGRLPEASAIVLRRNFGKALALQAGFDAARGSLIVTMDGDLQDDPEEIPRFLEEIAGGADLVSGWKRHRQDPLSKRLPSKVFNGVVRLVTGLRLHDINCGFKCYRREVLEEMRLYGELHRFVPTLAHARGFRVAEITVNHRPRASGHSKYGVMRLPKGFLDLLTVLLTTRYIDRPLHFFGAIGLLSSAAGFLILLWLSLEWFLGQGIGARPLFFLGILLTLVGVQIVTTGLLAEMIRRPGRTDHAGYCVRSRLGSGRPALPGSRR